MNQLNSLILEGNICREAEFKNTENGFMLATFPIAVNRYMKKSDGTYEPEVSYFDIESWGEIAKMISEKASKGQCVRIVGRLKQNRWKDSNGKNQSRISVVAEHIDLMQKIEKTEEPASTTIKNKKDNAPKTSFNREQLFGNSMESESTDGFAIF